MQISINHYEIMKKSLSSRVQQRCTNAVVIFQHIMDPFIYDNSLQKTNSYIDDIISEMIFLNVDICLSQVQNRNCCEFSLKNTFAQQLSSAYLVSYSMDVQRALFSSLYLNHYKCSTFTVHI
ncbi:Hypothetical predicted protein [Octopus vulgaris]|uniref:Uncharacterized protein n=1 Tax=Octopus vulgaris TaxID=6645 RepID=A0AA36F173_OCTVU|nr:Hypothetical predicted protein [Octopus vulgaris]